MKRPTGRDFTLTAYNDLLETVRDAGYQIGGASRYLTLGETQAAILLRHDVDRRPDRAVRMAELEADLGIASAYYFRAHRGRFPESAIGEIAARRHEIGYHYEDLAREGGDPEKAIAAFGRNLATLRRLAEVSTVCAHGSPLSGHDNANLFRLYDPLVHGVRDLANSIPHDGMLYISDSGRTIADEKSNLRDRIAGSLVAPEIDSTDALAGSLRECRYRRVHLNLHPERWTGSVSGWLLQLASDVAVAYAKRALGGLRG